jgi:hypothetical protein
LALFDQIRANLQTEVYSQVLFFSPNPTNDPANPTMSILLPPLTLLTLLSRVNKICTSTLQATEAY